MFTNLKQVLVRSALLLLLLAPSAAVRAADALIKKSNVLLIMADDLRDYGGAFTRDVVKTPNLDRLRARGVTFERAYVQYPVCSSMLTGLRAEQTGIVGNDERLRQRMPDVVTLPQLCKNHRRGTMCKRWVGQSLAGRVCGLVTDHQRTVWSHRAAGRSLKPILTNPAATTKDAAFTLVTRGPKLHGQSVRTQRWRFTQWSDGIQELYDHESDAEKNHNLAKANPTVVEELAARLKTLPSYRSMP